MKPWLSEPRGRQLEAFVGIWGIKTHKYALSGDLVFAACQLFDLNPGHYNEVEDTAEAIEALGRKERRGRALANRHLIASADDIDAKSKETPVTEEALEKMMADSGPQMVSGASQDCVGELDIDPTKLLLKVVSAVIAGGQGHILYDFPELLEFTKSRIPSRADLAGHTNTDERMFEAKAKWPNLIPGTQI